MKKIFSYNKERIQTLDHFNIKDIQKENKVWIDIENPSEKEISWIQNTFNIDKNILKQYSAGSKKPEYRILEEYLFTSITNAQFKNLHNLTTQAIYIFLGKNWLVTLHSSEIKLGEKIHQMFEEDKNISKSSINVLYYNILTKIVDNYEQLLTAVELALTEFEEKSLYRYSVEVLVNQLVNLKDFSHQLIIVRRLFWKIRKIFNFLMYQEEETETKENIKYLKILNNYLDELVRLLESHKETINSVRELYIANISLQLDDTIKTLTIFASILLPLTFITSFYGMNGLDLKSFNLPFGIYFVLAGMGIILIALIFFFRKKQWILRKEKISFPDNKNQN